jgi:hypothetical protein
VGRDLLTPGERWRVSLPLIFVMVFVFAAIGAQFIPEPGRIDREIVSSIRGHCQLPSPCWMTMGELLPGDWDRFVEESPRIMVSSNPQARDASPANALYLRRNVSLFKGRDSVRQESEQTGVDQRLDGEVVFAGLTGGYSGNVSFDSKTVFRIHALPTPGDPKTFLSFSGTYYLLTQQ